MNGDWVCFALIVSSIGLTGCVDAELSDPQVDLKVTQAEQAPGDCLFGDSGEAICHTLQVEITNNNENEDVSTNMFAWEAVGDDGGVYSADGRDGPDAVVAGSTASVTIEFETETGVTLETLRFEDLWMREPVTASIPS